MAPLFREYDVLLAPASLGLSAAALSGLRYALPRLVEGVASQLFLDDREAILGDYFAYAEEEFTLDPSRPGPAGK